MKSIVLHGSALDNAGGYCDAGTQLAIGTKAESGVITAERARALVESGRAVSATAAEAEEKAAAAGEKAAD